MRQRNDSNGIRINDLPPIHRPRSYRTKSQRYQPKHKKKTKERGYGRDHQKRREVFLAQNPFCKMCMAEGKLEPAKQLDHIVPLSRGGEECDDNYQALCCRCHARKSVEVDGALGRKRKEN